LRKQDFFLSQKNLKQLAFIILLKLGRFINDYFRLKDDIKVLTLFIFKYKEIMKNIPFIIIGLAIGLSPLGRSKIAKLLWLGV
jgi:hypothetical protein